MTGRLLLVTDLDGTLLGNDSSLQHFRRWLHAHRAAVTLVYATGRTVVDVERLIADDELPPPDHVVGSVGAEVYACSPREPHHHWTTRVATSWSRAAVCSALLDTPGLTLQPDEFQSELKVSCFLDAAGADQLQRIADRLADDRIAADVIYSGNRFVDVLPRGINKGSAAEFLAQELGFRLHEVIACGDSGNDVSLCNRGFRAVLVANADDDLVREARSPRYQSPYPHAAGVLDGIEFWTRQTPGPSAPLEPAGEFIRDDQPPRRRRADRGRPE